MAALLFRARLLGTISDASYRRAMTLMSKWGWRRREPGVLGPVEEPRMLLEATLLAAGNGYSEEALAAEVCLPVARLREILGLDSRPLLIVAGS